MARRKLRTAGIGLGIVVAAVAGVIVFWDWNWFIPLVDSQASAALGRDVTVGGLHVSLGRLTTVTADDVTVANPADFPQQTPFVQIGSLSVQADVMAYLRNRNIVLTQIVVRAPKVEAEQNADGKANWDISLPASKPGANASPSPPFSIGDLEIIDGMAHLVSPKLKANVTAAINTTHETDSSGADGEGRIRADAKGTYSAQPITARFIGGTLLSLRDAAKPYPIDLHIENGATQVSLVGTVQDPLNFAGANLKLDFSGADMSQLYPLTGVPIPQTPPFRVAGRLDIVGHTIKFEDFAGKVGSSDLEGTINVTPGAERPKVVAELESRRVDLSDLGGFIGSTPGRRDTPGESAAQRAAVARAEANPKLIPDTPINLPKLRAADVDLKYRGAHIEGRSVPLDNIIVHLKIDDGDIKVDPLNFGVGSGTIAGNVSLSPLRQGFHAKADVDFRRVDLSRLMEATHVFHGGGVIGGSANIDATGDSLAQLLGDGNGGVRLFMTGGNLSALLVDLSGLEFGNALLSALGIPQTATVRCFIGDLTLSHGVLGTKLLALDTSESNVYGKGDINLARETLNYSLQTKATHFTIGTLPTPIDITGTFKDPSIRPAVLPLAGRVGAAIGLGILFPPLALLPTIQLGLGEHNDCARMFHRE